MTSKTILSRTMLSNLANISIPKFMDVVQYPIQLFNNKNFYSTICNIKKGFHPATFFSHFLLILNRRHFLTQLVLVYIDIFSSRLQQQKLTSLGYCLYIVLTLVNICKCLSSIFIKCIVPIKILSLIKGAYENVSLKFCSHVSFSFVLLCAHAYTQFL